MQPHPVPRRLLSLLVLVAFYVALVGPAWAEDDPLPPFPPPAPPPLPLEEGPPLFPDVAQDALPGAPDDGAPDEVPLEEGDVVEGDVVEGEVVEGEVVEGEVVEGGDAVVDDTKEENATPLLGQVASGLTVGTQRIERAWHATFRMNYRMRTTGGDSDHDLYQYLQLDLGDEWEPGLSASFHGRLTEDLDGRSDEKQFFVFDSITDTYSSRVNGRLFHAFVNYRPRGGAVRQIRLGRQYVEGGDLFHVDGLSVEFGPPRGMRGMNVTVFGGVPAHLFESSPSGDVVAGIRVKGRLWARGEAEFDYVYLQDDTSYYGNEIVNLVSVSLRQQVARAASFWLQYQHLNEDPRQVYFNVNASDAVRDIFVRGAFHALLTAQNDLVTDLDPYFAVAQQLEPYWDGTVAVSKGFGDHVFLEGGVSVRRLFDEDDEGRFNHDFTRWFASISTDEWPRRHVFLTLTGEHWESDDRATTVGFEAEYRPSRRFRLQVGTDYQLYRFDLYTADERQSSRGYYVRVRYRPRDNWQLQFRLRVEDDAFDTYTTLFTGFEVDV